MIGIESVKNLPYVPRTNKKRLCAQRQSKQAYNSGDGAGAKELSNQGKAHDRKMDELNEQASNYIFRENNANGKVDGDEIDLHGQFVEEAERILEKRIRADQAAGQTHLHAIVGKGNHSTGGVQRLKPKIEELCREMGVRYRTEENEGRIYINLQGGEPLGPGHKPSGGHGGKHSGGHHGGQHGGRPSHHGGQHGGAQHGGPHHGGPQHGGHHQQQQEQEQDGAGELLPRIMRKLEKHCCIVM